MYNLELEKNQKETLLHRRQPIFSKPAYIIGAFLKLHSFLATGYGQRQRQLSKPLQHFFILLI